MASVAGLPTADGPEPKKGIFLRAWQQLFGEPDGKDAPSGVAGTTRLVIQVLWILFGAGLVIEFAYGWSLSPAKGFYFVVWAWIASLAAALAGGFLGLLFGLPSLPIGKPSTRVEAPPPPTTKLSNPSPSTPTGAPSEQEDSIPATIGGNTLTVQTSTARVEQDLPYSDSTSLEQIADWLTKIIVGLTLTQYQSWSRQFETLSHGLTVRLLGQQSNCMAAPAQPSQLREFCQASVAVPGASIILAFAILGFLMAYLWMRRYFIIEMVVGKRRALEVMAARTAAELEEQRARAEEQRVRIEEQRALAAEAARRAYEAEMQRITAELHAAQLRVNELIESARSMGNAQMQAPANAQKGEAQILANAATVVPQDERALAAVKELTSTQAETAHPDDPWLGRFGGLSQANGVQLLATVSPLQGSDQFFELNLEVKALSPERATELTGSTALYFLHPTFGNRPRPVTFGSDGRAPLQLYAYGAFTVGVLLQDGTTLELNLATIPNAPDLFRSR